MAGCKHCASCSIPAQSAQLWLWLWLLLGNHHTKSAELPSCDSSDMHGEDQMLVLRCKHPGPQISCKCDHQSAASTTL